MPSTATTRALEETVPAAPGACSSISLLRLLAVFLKLGALAFGGGMAIIAFMERELVHKRRVIAPDEFMNGVAFGQVVGPMAVNASFFVGYRLHGVVGGVLSLFAFVAPSVVLVIAIGWLYAAHQSLAVLQSALRAVQPAVIALIASAAWSMSRKAVRTWPAAALCAAGLLAGLGNINAIYVLAAGAACGVFLGSKRLVAGADEPSPEPQVPITTARRWGVWPLTAAALAPAAGISLAQIGITFLKLGVIWFGGAYTIVALMNQRIVEELHWLTPAVFRDGVAVANLTPGPMSVLATFTGYQLRGIAGALVATFALYVPATALMLFFCRNYQRMQIAGRTRDLLNGLNPCVVGLILSAGVLLSRGVLVNPTAWVLAVASFLLLTRLKWSPVYVLGISAALGVVFHVQ